MGVIGQIAMARSRLFGARQEMAFLHRKVCDEVRSGRIRIDQNIISKSIWNNYGLPLIGAGMLSDAERVYHDMLETIRTVESPQRPLHKGLALYNLGIAQFIGGKFEQAIPNILEAYQEDVRRVGAPRANRLIASRFRKDLYNLIGSKLDRDFIQSIRASTSQIRAASYRDLFAKMSESEFLMLGRIILSYDAISFPVDTFSSLVRFDNLRSACLLLEAFLKRRTRLSQNMGPLIESFFSGQTWLTVFRTHAGPRTHFQASSTNGAIRKFRANLRFLEGNLQGSAEEQYVARCCLTTVLVRHFTSHYLDGYEYMVKNKSTYSKILDRVIASLVMALDKA